jgi:hypothetical protein
LAAGAPARPGVVNDEGLLFVVAQAFFELVDGGVRCADTFDAMAAEVVRGMLEVCFGAAQ